MFYSQLLLSNKGALGIVWMAAHCHRRLKKDQVQQTNISSSIDKILDDEVPIVTHRILAFLLLGVVRIYSKKVEYLFHDCNEIYNRLCGLKTGKSTRPSIGVSRTNYHSVTLPKRFELDAFDLDLLEHQNSAGENVRSHKQDMLADDRRKDGSRSGFFDKENMQSSEAYSKADTPPRDVFSRNQWSSFSNMNISLAGLEVLRGTSFSLEDRLDPIILDEAEEAQMHNKHLPIRDSIMCNEMESGSVVSLSSNRSHSVPSAEIFCGTGFSLEDRLEPMVLNEDEEEQPNARPSKENISSNMHGPIQDVEFDSVANPSPQGSKLAASLETPQRSGFQMLNEDEKVQSHEETSDKEKRVDEETIEHLQAQMNCQENEPHEFTGSMDKHVSAKKMKSLEVINSESLECRRPKEFPMSVVVTPDSKLPAGLSSPEVVTVQTPATKERTKILKKRKTLFDLTTVVPNKVLKKWIEEDPSDLKRKRRDVPNTLLHAWRARKLANGPQSFFEPLFHGVTTDLANLECEKSWAAALKSVKISDRREDVRTPVSNEQIPEVRSPSPHRSYAEETPIAPGTPVTHLKPSTRSHEAAVSHFSLEPASSSETIDKCQSKSVSLEFDAVFQEEINSFDGGSSEKDAYSEKTRMIGRYLSRKFLDKKRHKDEEVLNLLQLLTRKTKKESARFFYEILVLKTRDCIDVQQENSYDDILLRETSKLKQAAAASSRN
ncbi:hypothetical protein ABFS82_08G001200 [Erythranthe guttata]|nr:PREDICTED: sister chromatid cohesion 1 protein 2 isoform X1 [Erythranthe guttata]|eukprot:XP_012850493.1 PREDICTED: sister chromatid cohesion 1 protein 2 isoform X1 [Erythranthe guttata]